MSRSTPFLRSDSASTLLCVAIFLCCVLCTRPFVETGVGDDFFYVWTAAHLAATGRMVYTGWSSPSLGYLAYLVAIFIRLMRAPYLASHLVLIIISVLNTALLQRVFLRIGINRFNSVVATCSVMLSPLCFPFAVVFLTDIPGMFALLLPLYCCIRALETASLRRLIWWACSGLREQSAARICPPDLISWRACDGAFSGMVFAQATGCRRRRDPHVERECSGRRRLPAVVCTAALCVARTTLLPLQPLFVAAGSLRFRLSWTRASADALELPVPIVVQVSKEGSSRGDVRCDCCCWSACPAWRQQHGRHVFRHDGRSGSGVAPG